jgi:choline-sulfatase
MSHTSTRRTPAHWLAAALLTAVASDCARKDPVQAENRGPAHPHVAASTAPTGPTAAPEPAGPRLTRPYNVVLILVDSLRADMPWNGYERDIAPNLTALAKRSSNFKHAYALSAYTAKSVGGLLGARSPSEMKRTGKFFTRWPDADNVFVSEVLRDAGHRTLGGHAHGYFHPQLEIHHGFADWRVLPNIILGVQAGITGDKHAALAIDMLSDPDNVSQANGKRFFAYFHFMDPHHTYEKHPELRTFGRGSLRDQYDHEVLFADHWLGKVFSFIEEQPWIKDTVLIVSADHGEGFGEHGHVRHGYEIWESVAHVPLLIHVPGVEPRTVDAFRSHLDLGRTILDLMGVEAPTTFRGHSLVPEMLGEPAPERPVVIDLPRCDLQDRRRAIIAPDGHKLISFGDDEQFKLFNVLEDPEESCDLSMKHPELLATMKRMYEDESTKIPIVEALGNEPLKGAPRGRRW